MSAWTKENNKLTREFEFADFNEAVRFVNRVAEFAEEADHHPDIFIHDYKRVNISLTTHSEGGVTEKDHALAEKINAL